MEVWRCVNCTSVYDEAVGHPKLRVGAGTPWHELPVRWKCPACGTSKSSFESIPLEEYLNQMFVLEAD